MEVHDAARIRLIGFAVVHRLSRVLVGKDDEVPRQQGEDGDEKGHKHVRLRNVCGEGDVGQE